MRKLVLLTGLCMLGVLTFGAAAVAQTVPMGTPPCPQALDQMPPGTTCGEGGGYIFPGENPTFSTVPPSPEAVGTATSTATATATPTATATATATSDATGGTAALPETGGLSVLSLAALGLLVAGGLLARRLVLS